MNVRHAVVALGIMSAVFGGAAMMPEPEPPMPTPTWTITEAPVHGTPPAVPAKAEDDPGWDCRTRGNRICGPGGSQYSAGCYRAGVLVIPWTNYADPHRDPLWAQAKSPC